MRYLVTGGAGFIGSHLAQHLTTRGDTVTTLDLRPGATVTGNICDRRLMDDLVRDADAVFHLAAVVGFANVMRDPIATIETSALGMTTVLDACHRHGKRLLFTSTSAVYGRTTDDARPVQETDPVRLGPPNVRSWCYAYAKATDECLALAYHQTKGFPVIVVRLFNTVGPSQSASAGFVLPRFVRCALAGKPLEVHAPGTQSRTFAHVGDVVDGLARLMECDKAVGEIVNLGGTATTTMWALAEQVQQTLESRSELRLVPDPYGAGYDNVAHRVPCLDKVDRLIGYRPTRGLDNIIADTVAALEVPA